jgi:hypothetical protein
MAQRARRSINVNGGLRFLPVYGESGSGKSSAARELGTHLPAAKVFEVPRIAIGSFEELKGFLREQQMIIPTEYELLAAVVDQYEEAVAAKGDIPSQFVEWLSLLDRDPEFNKSPWLFLWLTTSRDFRHPATGGYSQRRGSSCTDRAAKSGPL